MRARAVCSVGRHTRSASTRRPRTASSSSSSITASASPTRGGHPRDRFRLVSPLRAARPAGGSVRRSGRGAVVPRILSRRPPRTQCAVLAVAAAGAGATADRRSTRTAAACSRRRPGKKSLRRERTVGTRNAFGDFHALARFPETFSPPQALGRTRVQLLSFRKVFLIFFFFFCRVISIGVNRVWRRRFITMRFRFGCLDDFSSSRKRMGRTRDDLFFFFFVLLKHVQQVARGTCGVFGFA